MFKKVLNFFRAEQKQDIQDLVQNNNGILKINDGVIQFYETPKRKVYPKNAYNLFQEVSVIFDAVDKISSKAGTIKPIIKNPDGTIDRDHKFLKLLNDDIVKNLVLSQELTTESWLVARGNPSREPLELTTVRSYEIEVVSVDMRSGTMPAIIKTNSANDKRTYKREAVGLDHKYISEDGLNELIPIIGNKAVDDWRGLSKLSPLVQETLHIKRGNEHNNNVLKNGLTNSATFAPDKGETLDDIEVTMIKDSLINHYSGSQNAGKPLILPLGMNLVSQASNNKDMDYINLIDVDETRIFRLFNIPLPLVKSQSMTKSNFESAMPYLYSEAVLPVYSFILNSISQALFSRYRDLENKTLTFDEFSITALRSSHIETMKKLKETSVNTTNEIRTLGGYESIDDGGDVLINAGLIPLSDLGVEEIPTYSSDNIDE